MDWEEIIEVLHNAARSVGAEVTSPWFYLQLGLILTAAGLPGPAARQSARDRRLVGCDGVAAPLRLFVRVLVGSTSTAVFALLMTLERGIMMASTWPSRSYLLAVSAKLALRGWSSTSSPR